MSKHYGKNTTCPNFMVRGLRVQILRYGVDVSEYDGKELTCPKLW